MRQSIGTENRDHILKDIESLSLEKYVDEIAGAVVEGVGRCKTEKDVWSAVEVRNIHLISLSLSSLTEPYRSYHLCITGFPLPLPQRWWLLCPLRLALHRVLRYRLWPLNNAKRKIRLE